MVMANLVCRSPREDYFCTFSGIFLILLLQRYARKHMFQTHPDFAEQWKLDGTFQSWVTKAVDTNTPLQHYPQIKLLNRWKGFGLPWFLVLTLTYPPLSIHLKLLYPELDPGLPDQCVMFRNISNSLHGDSNSQYLPSVSSMPGILHLTPTTLLGV